MTTMKEIADMAQVSRATVSRVIAGSPLVKEGTRAKVLYWIEKTGFQPNRAAQGLIGGRTALIGLCLPSLTGEGCAAFVQAFEEETAKRGYDLLLGLTGEDEKREKNFPAMLLSRRADGFAAVGTRSGEAVLEESRIQGVYLESADPEKAAALAALLIDRIQGQEDPAKDLSE